MRFASVPYALVFPGQGPQFAGMGRRAAEDSAAAAALFVEAERITGLELRRLCFEGSKAELAQTELTQPSVFVASLATLAAFRERLASLGVHAQPAYVAGHSLGHFAALVAADVMDFADALRLVVERGRAMADAALAAPGTMAAIVGLAEDVVSELCARTDGIATIAAVNGPRHVVVSGEAAAVARVSDRAAAAGAERVVDLSIGVAAHSPLMAAADVRFRAALERASFRDAAVHVVLNTTGTATKASADVRSDLFRHMLSPVRWWHSVCTMVEGDVQLFAEVGPGRALGRAITLADPRLEVLSLDHVQSLRRVIA